MKNKRNYLNACLAFIVMMLLLQGSAMVIVTLCYMTGALLGSYGGINIVYDFLMKNQNIFSCIIYLTAAAAMLPWYYFQFIKPLGTERYINTATERLNPLCFVWLILLAVSVQHIVSLVLLPINLIFPDAMEQYSEMMEMSSATDYSFIWYIALIILPPLVEETVFRGLILGYLKKAGACFIVANLIQALFFGIFHLNFVQGVYTFFLGLILGYLAERYNSLAAPMVLHALFNLLGTVLVELENRFLPDIFISSIVIGSVPVFVFSIVMIHFHIGEKSERKAGV